MKCTLLDGPVAGENLEILRAPLFLRITQNGLSIHALDQEHQEPTQTDIVYIYVREGPQSNATYRIHTHNPKDSFVMQNHSWRGWVCRQPETIARTRHH